jgi:hypothetical protein
MITYEKNPPEWDLFIYELEDAQEHLSDLIENLSNGSSDEMDFKIRIFHLYQHLNRAWHSRNTIGEISSDQWEQNSQLPKNLNLFDDSN